ncbi:sugar phosphate isomerase/epimerase [Maribacter confluentis]|uniref:Sugar phosphate isomerase/epimerase n=2 Tax=Maribacter confluentis TaxID=1656093 RepID=A0ABT8RKC7_9FLAO|nr:sugar phosphate isomerase/epimerase [Maribacter confluentis]MDO1511432.1 sugar phosphate isomerase/epimerase [Maribacter confluentis]
MMKSNITFGVSTWLWQSPFTTNSIALFPKIKRMGFDVVEIPLENPSLVDVAQVKQALGDNGLTPTVCIVFGDDKDLTAADPVLHDNCFEFAKRCFEQAKELEVNFVAGPLYAAVGKARLATDEQRKIEWDRSVKNLRKLASLAREHALQIALEPLNRFESDLINTADEVMRLIGDINEDCVKVALDGFHMTIEENNIRKAINSVGDKLIHVQVSENHRGIPGTGLTPWQDFADGLKDIEYNGAMVIESFTPEIKELAAAVNIWRKLADDQDSFAKQGLEFLKRTFND